MRADVRRPSRCIAVVGDNLTRGKKQNDGQVTAKSRQDQDIAKSGGYSTMGDEKCLLPPRQSREEEGCSAERRRHRSNALTCPVQSWSPPCCLGGPKYWVTPQSPFRRKLRMSLSFNVPFAPQPAGPPSTSGLTATYQPQALRSNSAPVR